MTEPTGSKVNTILLTAVLGVAGTVGYMVIQQGQSLAGITQLLQEHTAYFKEVQPFEQETIRLGQRMDGAEARENRLESHLDATDSRVDVLERTTAPRRVRPE